VILGQRLIFIVSLSTTFRKSLSYPEQINTQQKLVDSEQYSSFVYTDKFRIISVVNSASAQTMGQQVTWFNPLTFVECLLWTLVYILLWLAVLMT